MIYIDLKRLILPDDLKSKLADATTELLTKATDKDRQSFIERKSDLWKETRPYLAKLSGINEYDYKCWYCECKGAGFSFHTEHFRPKKRVVNKPKPPEPGYWWLAFDLDNYRLSCEKCNSGSGKMNAFPIAETCLRASCPTDDIKNEIVMLLDPTRSADCIALAFSADGKVYPSHASSTHLGKQACTSIQIYDLNHFTKEEARKQVWLECERLAQRAQRAYDQLLNAKPDALQAATERFEDLCASISMKVASTAEFSAMARFCFRSFGQDWLTRLAG